MRLVHAERIVGVYQNVILGVPHSDGDNDHKDDSHFLEGSMIWVHIRVIDSDCQFRSFLEIGSEAS
jgi:protocatechuate 3,4-dioxygenase beta subunit